MATEVIEGEAVEVSSAVVVHQPGNALVSDSHGPVGMIEVASTLASALKDIVERQHLYANIQGKRFPTVEAWMTIGRMDNVVAREAERPIRNDDGSYEAFVELIRLSDGMVIGRASALCGSSGDRPWDNRPDPAKRSMAVTRATSRAFRQQYSWIMALAGYEPTPAEEMPRDEAPARAGDVQSDHDAGGLVGKADIGNPPSDFELRQTPEGWGVSFRLKQGTKAIKVIAKGPLAEALFAIKATVVGQTVTCWGSISEESFKKDGRDITYRVLALSRIQTPDATLPMETADAAA